MSFYADLPPPSSGVDPGKTSASSGWNASQKLSAPPQRKQAAPSAPIPTVPKPVPLPRALVTPPTPPPPGRMVNTSGLKPPPQRPQQVTAPKLSTAQLASLSESSTAALSAILANQPVIPSTTTTTIITSTSASSSSSDVNLLEDDSIQNKYNPIRPNDYEEFRLERDRRRKLEDEQKRAEAQEAKLRKKQERDEAAGFGPSKPVAPKLDLAISGDDAYARRVAMSQGGASSSAPVAPSPAPAAPKIDLAMSGEEAFARRAAMSRSAGAPQQAQAFAPSANKKQRTDDTPSSELESVTQTKIVLLRNMVGRGEVDSDLEPEVSDECTKYGKVVSCQAISLSTTREPREDYAVRIFVSFTDVKSATSAVAAMEGRFFAGRRVSACFVKEDVYARGDLTV